MGEIGYGYPRKRERVSERDISLEREGEREAFTGWPR